MLFLNDFVSYLSAFRSEKTIKQKEINLKAIQSFFDKYGETYNFDQETIAKLFNFLRKEKKYKLTTIKAIFTDLKIYIRFLKRKGIEAFFDNEALKFIFQSPKLKNEEQKERKESSDIFTSEELKKVLSLLRETNEIYYLFACFIAFSGLRLSEALKVKAEDLEEIKEGFWKVKVRSGKFGKERLAFLIIPEEFKDVEAYLKEVKEFYNRTGNDILFKYRYSDGGKVYRLDKKKVSSFFYSFSKRTGIRITPHKLRKTFATLLATKIENPFLLKEILGHEDIRTTSRYYVFAKKLIEDTEFLKELPNLL
jgi:integrase